MSICFKMNQFLKTPIAGILFSQTQIVNDCLKVHGKYYLIHFISLS